MADKKTILTYAGLKALEEELENLKVVKRKEVAAKIKEAREQEMCIRDRRKSDSQKLHFICLRFLCQI